MRKDLRYGLGIGGLGLAFGVTFLVVKNHTQNQYAQDDGDPIDPPEQVDGGAPESNPAPPAADNGPTPNATSALPPLPPMAAVQGNGVAPPVVVPPTAVPPAPVAPPNDAFAPRPPGTVAGNPKQDWDRILETGHVPGAVPPRVVVPPRTAPASPTPPRSTGAVASARSSTTPGSVRAMDAAVSPRPPAARGSLGATTSRSYTIRDGDTYTSIAKAHYGATRHYLKIEQANPNLDPGRLRAGQTIVLPDLDPSTTATPAAPGPFGRAADNRVINPRTEYRVDTGDSLYRISSRVYGTPRMVDALYDVNREAIGPDPTRLRFGMILKLPQATASSR